MAYSKPPVVGSVSTAGTTVVPLGSPVLDRPIWLTLKGSWAGNVTLLRSTDGGATKLPLTFGDGSPKPTWSGNMQAPVAEESVSAATYYLSFVRTSGTLEYRMEQ